jgi:hypothetical protein
MARKKKSVSEQEEGAALGVARTEEVKKTPAAATAPPTIDVVRKFTAPASSRMGDSCGL